LFSTTCATVSRRGAECDDGRARPRHGHDFDAGLLRCVDQTPTGIADQRRAGIADERHGFTAIEPLQELRHALLLVVLVIRDKSRFCADSR
jgi:hypothetical protein